MALYYDENEGIVKDFTTKDISVSPDAIDRAKEIMRKNNERELSLKRKAIAVGLALAMFSTGTATGIAIGRNSTYSLEKYMADYEASDDMEKDYLDEIRNVKELITKWENDQTVENRVEAVSAIRDMRDISLELLALELGAKRVSYEFEDKNFKVVVFDNEGNKQSFYPNQVADEVCDIVESCESIDFYFGTGENGNWDKAMRGFTVLSDEIFEGTAKLTGRQNHYIFNASGIKAVELTVVNNLN